MTLFFSSDLHLCHENILKFVSEESFNQVRPGFDNVEQMNEYIVEKHNSVVKPTDKWYCLGDLLFGMKNLGTWLSRMNGHKRLILGNHDYAEKKDFLKYFDFFEKIMESRRMDGIVFTHRPILIGPEEGRIKANVHGHIHEKVIDDPRYMNISVEQIDYIPVSYEEIEGWFKARGIDTKREERERVLA